MLLELRIFLEEDFLDVIKFFEFLSNLTFPDRELLLGLVQLHCQVTILFLHVVDFHFLFLSMEYLRFEGNKEDLDLFRGS